VPTLYLRNVPTEVVDALKRRAASHRRSLNAEAVALLSEVAAEQRPLEDVFAEIRAIAARNDFAGLDPVELVRAGREERTKRVLGE
jgi:plasmid stability protein